MDRIDVIELLPELMLVCRRCPTIVLTQAYVSAAREFCNKSRWLQTSVTGATAATKAMYDLGDDPYEEIIGIKAVSLEGANGIDPLTEQSSVEWDPDDETDEPEFYCYVPHAQLAVHPTPGAVYAMTVALVLQPKRGQNSLPRILAMSWDETLRAGALARLLEIPAMPWSNPQLAQVKRQLFTAGINSAKSDEQAGFNAGAVATNRPGAPNGRLRSRVQPL